MESRSPHVSAGLESVDKVFSTPSRYLSDCILLGGFAEVELTFGSHYDLGFGATGILVGDRSAQEIVIEIPYEEIGLFDVGGPGEVTNGPGLIGGGFGVKGAVEGILTASVINRLFTKVKIQTVVTIRTETQELILLYSGETPDTLRITLSPVFGRIRLAHKPGTPPPAAPNVAEGLGKLAELLDRGLLTPDQFEASKRRLLEGG